MLNLPLEFPPCRNEPENFGGDFGLEDKRAGTNKTEEEEEEGDPSLVPSAALNLRTSCSE